MPSGHIARPEIVIATGKLQVTRGGRSVRNSFVRVVRTAMVLAACSLCSVIVVPVARGQQPSFNCATNRAPDESAICGSAALSQLDVEMSNLYFRLRDGLGPSQQVLLREAQRYWLGRRAACGRNVNCITRLYEDRIPNLNAVLAGTFPSPAHPSSTPLSPTRPGGTPLSPTRPGGTPDACTVWATLC
jgi:uncharacterized protein YecT (DUF1311 family)